MARLVVSCRHFYQARRIHEAFIDKFGSDSGASRSTPQERGPALDSEIQRFPASLAGNPASRAKSVPR